MVPIGPVYGKKYNALELWEISSHYEKFGWIYEMKLSKERLDNLNMDLINKLCGENTFQIKIYQSKYIEPQEERDSLLERIKSDDYSNNFNCILANRSAYDRKIFLNLVCDNEFLEIVEGDLLKQELPNIVINHIIEILEMSIHFKKLDADRYEDFWIYYNQLGEKIKVYDYRKAENLIPLLKRKTNKKIIKFISNNE